MMANPQPLASNPGPGPQSPSSSNGSVSGSYSIPQWYPELKKICDNNHLPLNYTLQSETRGRRTAWRAVMTFNGKSFQGRYFFEGDYINNCITDAAEIVLKSEFPSIHDRMAMGHPGTL